MNKNFEEAKMEYEKIKAPEKLKQEVNRMFETSKKGNGKGWHIAVTGIAAIFMAFVVSLNASESFAKSVSNFAGLDGVVKILTAGKYEMNTEYTSANIETPEIKGLLDKEFEEKLNAEFKENANVVMKAFEDDIQAMEESGLEWHMGVDCGYQVKVDTEDLLVLDVYVVNMDGSSSTVHKFYNIDKKNNHLITLKEWVKDEDYIEKINDYIKKEMKRREDEIGHTYFWNDEFAFETITEDTKFYINANGNAVISFEKYEIAPGAYGNVEFEIPNEIFE